METQCLQTNETQHYLGKEKLEELEKERKKCRRQLKVKFYARVEKRHLGRAMKDRSK